MDSDLFLLSNIWASFILAIFIVFVWESDTNARLKLAHAALLAHTEDLNEQLNGLQAIRDEHAQKQEMLESSYDEMAAMLKASQDELAQEQKERENLDITNDELIRSVERFQNDLNVVRGKLSHQVKKNTKLHNEVMRLQELLYQIQSQQFVYHLQPRSASDIMSDPGSPRDGAESVSSMPSSAGLSDRGAHPLQVQAMSPLYSFSAAYAGNPPPAASDYSGAAPSFLLSDLTNSSASSSSERGRSPNRTQITQSLSSPRLAANSGSVSHTGAFEPNTSHPIILPSSFHPTRTNYIGRSYSSASSSSGQEFRMRYYQALGRDPKKKPS